MKIKVNRDACICCGACQTIAPNVFELDQEGVSVIKKEVGTPNDDQWVSVEEDDSIKDASESCPTGAIEISN